MAMNVSWFIARRYVRAHHSLHFIGIISILSVCGNAIGVAAIIIVLAIFSGFSELIESFLVGFDPHVRISAADGALLQGTDSLLQQISTISQISAAGPVISSKAVAFAGAHLQALTLKGVPISTVEQTSGLADALVVGRLALEEKNGSLSILVGAGIADNMRVITGDTLLLLSPKAITSAVARSLPPARFTSVVRGIFESNNAEYDFAYAYTSIESARRLLGLPFGSAHSIDIRLYDFQDAFLVQSQLRQQLGSSFRVETWFDLHRDLYSIMKFERIAAFVILSLIIVVAGFNVFASLSMSMMEKKSELALLKAIGATDSAIANIFRLQSFVIGSIGTISGTVLGIAFCLGQQYYGWFALDATKYKISAIPVSLHWETVVLTIIFSFTVTIIAGLIPANNAARLTASASLINDNGR